jgi:hypothetical protein
LVVVIREVFLPFHTAKIRLFAGVVCASVRGFSGIGKWHFRGWKMAFYPSHYGILALELWHFGY